MTERFYFDIENGLETIRDEEGVEVSGLKEAIDEARSVISEVYDELESSLAEKKWVLVVRNANRMIVGRLPIKK
ncbi:hypothetical protein FV242_27375 [Methylobacterium sp. WL64]|uniref:DUF6894 family protein n=1 Tax=Methylobacterium sp. WL64 TaxID=2603894 RepID=UPI0011CC82DF|nr:hypothetical protein [Methylobacterium sp. WL64]TXM98881.1 hypothetical protein FV242_27375 [Methylobacterium sp. WL64]